jgi:anti-anti-sigma factor
MTSRGSSLQPEPRLSKPRPDVPVLQVLPSREDGQVVLTLVGEIDVTTAGVVPAAARDCLRGRPARLSLDLRAVNFCDVAGVRALRQARREALAARAEFRIIAPGPMLVRVITLANAGDLLSAVGQAAGLGSTSARSAAV